MEEVVEVGGDEGDGDTGLPPKRAAATTPSDGLPSLSLLSSPSASTAAPGLAKERWRARAVRVA